jgi:glycosyltransferase involved in cell wall biosynthesis
MQKRKLTILFVCPYPIGKAPSQRFRFEQYFDVIKNEGIDFKIKPFFSYKTWSILYSKGNFILKFFGIVNGFMLRLFTLFSVPKYDYIFIHREATPIGPPIFEFLCAKIFRKKIIYDFDDAIWLPNTSEENWLAAKLKWHIKVKSICSWSYKVSCGNEFLCNYAKQFSNRVYLNPTTIDTHHLHNRIHITKNHDNKIIIGWTGSHSTLKYLNVFEKIFNVLEQKYPSQLELMVIADKKPDLAIKSLRFKSWTKENEIDDLLNFDIGIMPLTDDAWAKGKCGFKALQYMALGIPVVTSPVGVNSVIVDQGMNGFLCTTTDEWINSLEKLINNKSLRENMGASGRKKIIDHYSVASNSSNFLSLLQ